MKKKLKLRNTKRKHNELVRIILIVVLVLSIGILIGAMSYVYYMVNIIPKSSGIISITKINASVQITESTSGMNADKDSLKFGKVPLGGGMTRYLKINSTSDALVNVEISGNISPFLSLDKNNFVAKQNSLETISFQLDVPYDAQLGNYTGDIKVTLLKTS